MSLSAVQFLSVFLVPTLLGIGLLHSLGIRLRDDRLAFFGWAYTAGSFGTGAVLFAWLWLGWPLDARLLAPALLLLAAALGFIGSRTDHTAADSERPPARASALERWLLVSFVVVLLLVTLDRILLSSFWPITLRDEARIWALKAKLLFHAGGFNDVFRAHAGWFMPSHLDYPPLNPLLQVWTFAHAREILHVENRLPIQCFAVALVLAGAGALRQLVRPGLAAVLLVLLISAEHTIVQSKSGSADLMVALGFLVALDAWLRWMRTGSPRWWKLCMLGLAFMMWSKNEGALYFCAFAGAASLSFARPSFRARHGLPSGRLLAWVLLPLGITAATWWTNAHFGFANDMATGSALDIIMERFDARIGPVLAYHGNILARLPEHNHLLFVVLAAFVVAFPARSFRGTLQMPTSMLLMVLTAYVVVYLATPQNLDWHLSTSATRVFYQSLPVLTLWVALAAASIFPPLASEKIVGASPIRVGS